MAISLIRQLFHMLTPRKQRGGMFNRTQRIWIVNIQFSVVNSDGKIFSASAPIETDVFQNIVGEFDRNAVKIYSNGFLIDKVAFKGVYNSD